MRIQRLRGVLDLTRCKKKAQICICFAWLLTSTSSQGHPLHDEFDNQVEKLNYKERGREGRRERRRKRELENTDVPTLKYMNS